MVNVMGVPGHPVAVGVTVMVLVTGVVPALVAVNDPILPTPEPAKPMVVLLFVQLNTVPVTAPVKLMAAVGAPVHNVWFATAFTLGPGFTVMVNVMGVPGQPLAVGVTVMVLVTGAVPALVAVKAGIFPTPLPPKPMDVLLFVQLNTVPVTVPAKFTAVVGVLLHKVWLPTAVTVGVGFTVMVNVMGVPGHPLAVGVTVMVLLIGVVPALVAVNEGSVLDPEAPEPMAGLLLVQLKVVPVTAPAKVTAVDGAPAHRV